MRESFHLAEPFIFHITVEAARALQFKINRFPFTALYWLSGFTENVTVAISTTDWII